MQLDVITESKKLLTQPINPRPYYYEKLSLSLATHQIVVIQGQRRIGKSSLVLGYLQHLAIPSHQIFFFNKKVDIKNTIKNATNIQELFQTYIQNVGEPTYLIIDEIQDIIDRERFIRAVYVMKKYHIIITGSNAHLLSGELATYLSGRYVALEVYPLGYDEYLAFTQQQKNAETFNTYMQFGGMPELIHIHNTEGKKQYLTGIMNTIFMKDIVKRYAIKDVSYLEKVIAFLADIIGTEISLRNIYNISKQYGWGEASSLNKLINYIQMLQVPYIIHKVSRYDIRGKRILEYNEKYFFNDIGLRNTIKLNEDLDKGKLLENMVFLHLKTKGYTVYIGNYYGKEIDFIAQRDATIVYIQIAWNIQQEKTQQREFDNLLHIKDNYPKYVITTDTTFGKSYYGIQSMNIIDFLTTFN